MVAESMGRASRRLINSLCVCGNTKRADSGRLEAWRPAKPTGTARAGPIRLRNIFMTVRGTSLPAPRRYPPYGSAPSPPVATRGHKRRHDPSYSTQRPRPPPPPPPIGGPPPGRPRRRRHTTDGGGPRPPPPFRALPCLAAAGGGTPLWGQRRRERRGTRRRYPPRRHAATGRRAPR